jgi:hypothetical protein
MSQKKPTHIEKTLKGMSRRVSKSASYRRLDPSLREQYAIIRQDLQKLRDDLHKGYDMAKGMVEKRSFLGQIFKAR